MAEKKETNVAKTPKFTKEQFLNSTNPIGNLDALFVVLEDNKLYTESEAEKLLNDFLNKEVK